MLSLDAGRLVVSCQTAEGAPVDFAIDLATGREIDLGGSFDPLAVSAPGGLRLTIEGGTTGRMPVLCAADAGGRFLWDSRWAAARGFESAEWLSVVGRPVVAGDRVLFGIRETTLERGAPQGYRLAVVRLADGRAIWDRLNHGGDREVLGTGFDGRSFWVLANQRDGVPRLRFHDPESGEPRGEARFPGLTGGIAIADGALYGGFGRSLVAVELTI